jgi:putative transposase
MEAYTNGVSTRKVERLVERLVEQLGVESMSKSQVSRICQALDQRVEPFRNRRLDNHRPHGSLAARPPISRVSHVRD